jgi:NAD-dependent dihydropyrimidine dehydrogenase PreA subunit
MEVIDVYRRLQRHLDRMPIGFPATVSGVEIRILERIFTPDEAEIALEVSAIPEPLPTIHRRLRSRLSLDSLRQILDRMAAKGAIHRTGPSAKPSYGKLVFAVGMYELQLGRLTPELDRDVRQYFEEAFGAAFHASRTRQLRTVPINTTIRTERDVARYDDIRGYVEANDGPFGAMTCICRHGKDLRGEPCRQTRLRENCLTIGASAKAMARQGLARFVDRGEMLALLSAADDEGLVLQPQNTRSPTFVCCCCGCCCGVLTAARRLPQPASVFDASFHAEVDQGSCESCGLCRDRCQMGAVSLDHGPAAVDLGACIGCGLCVTTCPSGAIRLAANASSKIPPPDTPALYMRIFRERYGTWGTAKAIGRRLLGLKI